MPTTRMPLLVLAAMLATGCAAGAAGRGAMGDAPPSPAVVARVPLDGYGTDVQVSPDGSTAWVATTAQMQGVDLARRTVASTIRTGDIPYRFAISRDGTKAWAVDLMERMVLVVDLRGGTVLRRIWIEQPTRPALRPGIAVSPDETYAVVSISDVSQTNDELQIVDLAGGGGKQTRRLDFHPGPLATSADGGTLFVAGCHGLCSDGTVHAYALPALAPLGQVDIPTLPGDIARGPGGRRLYVSNGLGAGISILDPVAGTKERDIPTGAGALGIAPSPDGRRVYVTNFDAGTLSVVDPAAGTTLSSTPIGARPRAIALSADGRFAYVTHSTPILSIVDTSLLGAP